MKSEKLQNAIGLIDEELLEDAQKSPKSKKAKAKYYVSRLAPIAAVLVVLIAVGAVLAPFMRKDSLPTEDGTATTATPYDFTIPTPSVPSGLNRPPVEKLEDTTLPFCVAQAHYPAMAQYPQDDVSTAIVELDDEAYDAWKEDRAKQRTYLQDTAPLDIFFLKSMQEFLVSEDNENLIYSPVNVFMALCMCAEISSGNTREQILSLLGAEDIEDLRSYAYAVWNGSYCDDGTVKSILANSVWLNEDINFNEDVIKSLAQNYFASTFSGKAGSNEFTQALRDWINQQTGNLLKDEVNALEITPETIMSLVSTIYFKAKWDNEFSEKNTKEDIFYSKDGEITCDFMNNTNSNGTYYWGDKFSATSLGLSESGKMWFVLPDEGVEVNDLIGDPELQDFLLSDKYSPDYVKYGADEESVWSNQKRIKINFSMPKFDTKSTIDLKDGLKNLGVTDCFSPADANFSSLTNESVFVSGASHSARVIVDEEGVIATAFTVMILCGSAMPPDDEVDFILNRPFLFFIENEEGVMLFSGVVNNP